MPRLPGATPAVGSPKVAPRSDVHPHRTPHQLGRNPLIFSGPHVASMSDFRQTSGSGRATLER